jgi:hypothetical protein
LAASTSYGKRLSCASVQPLMPGPTISAVGRDWPRITVFLMPSMSIAW